VKKELTLVTFREIVMYFNKSSLDEGTSAFNSKATLHSNQTSSYFSFLLFYFLIEWICSFCGFVNEANTQKCVTCLKFRETSRKKQLNFSQPIDPRFPPTYNPLHVNAPENIQWLRPKEISSKDTSSSHFK